MQANHVVTSCNQFRRMHIGVDALTASDRIGDVSDVNVRDQIYIQCGRGTAYQQETQVCEVAAPKPQRAADLPRYNILAQEF